MFFWNAISAETLVEGDLLEFVLEGQRTRQRYFCVQHACRYAHFVSFRCARLPLMGIKKAKMPTTLECTSNGFKQLKTCVLMI